MREITNPAIFIAASVLLVGYIAYMMLRKRRGERPGHVDRDSEL